ncbi:MAG: DUF4382 domain-containing protein [Gemmatimonadales bacterium]
MRRDSRPFTTLLLALLAVAACGDTSGPEGGVDGPRVTIQLTDAAGDIKAAVVTISEIFLQGSGNTKVTLSSIPVTTDLIDLANSTAVIVDEAVVPAGTYNDLRFVLSGGYIEVENASGGTDIYASSPTYSGLPPGAQVTGQLQMPSLGTSGLKVQIGNATTLSIGEDQDWLVDFDVSQSFGHQAGNSGMWVMHPVVKGAVISEAATFTASIALGTGVTLPVVGGTQVTLGQFKAELNGEQVTFTDPDGNGTFEAPFRFLLPGTYTLKILPPSGVTITTNPASPMQVTVGVGATVTQTVTIATATAG